MLEYLLLCDDRIDKQRHLRLTANGYELNGCDLIFHQGENKSYLTLPVHCIAIRKYGTWDSDACLLRSDGYMYEVLNDISSMRIHSCPLDLEPYLLD